MTVVQISDYRRETPLKKRQPHRRSSGLLIACVMTLACVVLFIVVAGAESYLGSANDGFQLRHPGGRGGFALVDAHQVDPVGCLGR